MTDERSEPPEPSDEKMYTSEPLEDEHGDSYVIRQQNVGPGSEAGGGEWPDPATPPSASPRNDPEEVGDVGADDADGVDEAGKESCPASDPPAWNVDARRSRARRSRR